MNNRVRTAWLFLAPMLLLMAVVAVWPLLRSVWFGFTETNINNMQASRFIGLENYFGPYGLFFNPNYADGFWASDWGTAIRNTFQFAELAALELLAGVCVVSSEVQRNSLVPNQLSAGASDDDLGLNASSGQWSWESSGWLFAESTLNLDLVNSLATLVGLTGSLTASAHGGIRTWLCSRGLRTSRKEQKRDNGG